MSSVVVVVAAHPDDEVLGCGGTIARHVDEGDKVFVIFMADGVSSRGESDHKSLIIRNEAAENAKNILRITQNYHIGFPDNRLDSIPLIEITQKLEKIIGELKPSIVYTHHIGDLNIDHRITHQAVLTACRPMPHSSVREIYAFEVLSSTEWASFTAYPFMPNHYVNISEQMEIKIGALKAYEMEMRDAPHSRSIENLVYLARHRGHTVGVMAAEAFVTVRVIR